MKVVQVRNTRYFIQDKDDEISIAHELARKGFSIAQISQKESFKSVRQNIISIAETT